MSLKTYTEARARRAGSHLVTGCTGGCHFDTVRCGQGGRSLSLWWPYGLRLPDLVYILSFLFIMNITEMIGISLRIVLRFFHDLMFLLCWEIKNSWFLIPDSFSLCGYVHRNGSTKRYKYGVHINTSWECENNSLWISINMVMFVDILPFTLQSLDPK